MPGRALEYMTAKGGRDLRIAVYPGSFDPVTNGHLDVAQRAARMFDKLVVAVFVNSAKTPLFSPEERVEMWRRSVADLPNVTVTASAGLLIDFVREHGATCIVKGLRAIQDFEYEFQMALTNKQLAPEVETVFLMTDFKYAFLSSTIIRDLARYGAPLTGMVPEHVAERLRLKLGQRG